MSVSYSPVGVWVWYCLFSFMQSQVDLCKLYGVCQHTMRLFIVDRDAYVPVILGYLQGYCAIDPTWPVSDPASSFRSNWYTCVQQTWISRQNGKYMQKMERLLLPLKILIVCRERLSPYCACDRLFPKCRRHCLCTTVMIRNLSCAEGKSAYCQCAWRAFFEFWGNFFTWKMLSLLALLAFWPPGWQEDSE